MWPMPSCFSARPTIDRNAIDPVPQARRPEACEGVKWVFETFPPASGVWK